jgi:hypothetical protein
MKKEIKKIITIIKAAPQLKTRIISALLFLIVGILFELGASRSTSYGILGAVYLSITTTYIFQSVMSVCCSGLVQTSSSAKKLQVKSPLYIKSLMNIIFFFIISLHRVYIASKPEPDISIKESISLQCFFILSFSALYFFLSIYEIISYKFFWLSLVGIILLFVPMVIGIHYAVSHAQFFYNLTFPVTITSGFLIILIGSLLSIALANLLYKYPISAHVMRVNNKA